MISRLNYRFELLIWTNEIDKKNWNERRSIPSIHTFSFNDIFRRFILNSFNELSLFVRFENV